MALKDMNANEFKALIREAFEEALEEFFGDPDEGKELRTEVKEQLVELVKKRQAGARGIPAEEA
jgi:hypothetical protein